MSAGKQRCASESKIRVFREGLARGGIDPRPREAEIDEVKAPRVLPQTEKKVAGFDVAVDDSFLVEVFDYVQLRSLYA